jgi:hypothetical protein
MSHVPVGTRGQSWKLDSQCVSRTVFSKSIPVLQSFIIRSVTSTRGVWIIHIVLVLLVQGTDSPVPHSRTLGSQIRKKGWTLLQKWCVSWHYHGLVVRVLKNSIFKLVDGKFCQKIHFWDPQKWCLQKSELKWWLRIFRGNRNTHYPGKWIVSMSVRTEEWV